VGAEPETADTSRKASAGGAAGTGHSGDAITADSDARRTTTPASGATTSFEILFGNEGS
jgi:hypothetical protein